MRKFIFMIMALVASVTMSAQHVEQSKAFDNTYVSVGGGGTIQTPLINGFDDLDNIRPVIGLELGKDLTTLYGMSIEGKTTINNKDIHTAFDDFSVVWNHKLNLTNMLLGFKEGRKWDVRAVGGIGWGHDNGCVVDNYLVGEAGLEVNRKLSNALSLKLNPTFVWNDVCQGLDANKSEIELSVGLTYHFKNHDGGRGFNVCNFKHTQAEVDALNDVINKQRNESLSKDELLKQMEASNLAKDKEIAELKSREMNTVLVLPNSIGFEIGSSKINKTHVGDLITLSKIIKDNNLKVEIVGYADKQTGSAKRNQELSEQRAESVKNELLKLGVSADSITTIGKGSEESVFEENDLNRVAITVVK